MKTTLSIAVNRPCAENWNSFSMAKEGRHCGSCNKVVVDFTAMSDTEIVKYFQQKRSATCGRLRPDQLKTYNVQQAQIQPGLSLLKAGLAGMLVLFLTTDSNAQVTDKKDKVEVLEDRRDATGADELTTTVTGTVVSADDGSALPGVNVVLKGSVHGTVTDADGRFRFPEELKEGDVLVFTFVGLQTQEYTIRPFKNANVNMPMEIDTKMICMVYDMMGEVVTTDRFVEEPSVFKKAWRKVKNLF